MRGQRAAALSAIASGAVCVGASLAGAGAPARWELATFRWVNDLPSWLYVPLWPLMQYGALGAIPVTAGVALLFRRRRLGFSIAAAGSVGYVSAKIIKGIVERGRPADFLTDVKVREHFGAQSLGYPSGHAVVAATITTICVAYLPRRWSRAAVLLTATVAFARIYSGGHLALDVIGGAGLGVMLGLLAGLVGTDGPTPELQTMHTDEVAEGDAHDADPVARLVAPNIRHPGDVVRVSAGIVVLVITVLAVYRDRLSTFETNLFRLINDLPSAIAPCLNVVMQAGNALAGPVLALLVLAIGSRRRWRQAFDLAVAGTLAWVAAKVVKDIIQRPRPGGLLEDVARFGSDGGLGFVSGHTAVAAALATAAAPYLARNARRAVWLVPWIVGLARIYFGAHLPLDVVGGAALGWIIGAGLHLMLGAPHGGPTLDEAAAVLRGAGWSPTDVERVPGTPKGSFPFVAAADGGSIFVKLLDPDTRDRDLIVRVTRLLAFRDVRDAAAVLDAPAQANREAAMSLLARQHGARVPMVRAIARHRHHVWLVLDRVPSEDLRRVASETVTDEFLHQLWAQLSVLRGAGIAHRDLVASNILVDADGSPWIVDFAHAESSPGPHMFDNDVAELLVSTSLLVGPARAVEAAVHALGAGPVGASLPELVPLALTPEARRRLRGSDQLELLRDVVTERTAALRPQLRRPLAPPAWRIGIVTTLVVGVITTLVVIAGAGDVVEALSDVSVRWLGVATLAASVAVLVGAASLVAAIERPLAIGRAVAIRAIAGGAAFAGGRSGEAAIVVDQLSRSGIPEEDAAAAVGRTRLAAWATWAAVTSVALVESLDAVHWLVRPDHLEALATVVIVAWSGHVALAVLSNRRRSESPVALLQRQGDRPGASRTFSWVLVATAKLVEVAAGALPSSLRSTLPCRRAT